MPETKAAKKRIKPSVKLDTDIDETEGLLTSVDLTIIDSHTLSDRSLKNLSESFTQIKSKIFICGFLKSPLTVRQNH